MSNAQSLKISSEREVTATDDREVTMWLSYAMVQVAATLISTTANAPESVRKAFTRPSMVDHELARGVLDLMTPDKR